MAQLLQKDWDTFTHLGNSSQLVQIHDYLEDKIYDSSLLPEGYKEQSTLTLKYQLVNISQNVLPNIYSNYRKNIVIQVEPIQSLPLI